ncbi:MAG TPA: TldD/PmbA family protein [Gemmatimonadales bacterium]|nr:TldD/PmbA family protein [Gemmatimonadales bacterium]
MAEWFSRDEARRLADRVLALSRADGCQVNLVSGESGNTRYAVAGISTSGDTTNATVTVTSRFGKRVASVSTNRFDDAGLRRAVDTSERLARLAPENPELMPLLGPQQYAEIPAFSRATAELDAARRADTVRAALEVTDRAGLVAAGFVERLAGASAVANSAGLFAYHASTAAVHTLTVRTPDWAGSGWAGTAHNDWRRVTPGGALAERAARKARESREPVTLEPGKYTVVLEPTAAGNLLRLLAFALNARQADEGRSFFSKRGGGNKIGEQVVDRRVTILSDPADPDLLLAPYTGEGLPVERTVWIENGVVRNLVYDRFWADRQGVKPVPFPGGFKMLGGEATLDELVAQVDRGVLVTRFWYIRGVDPRTVLYTGLTRDGVFLIENGRVTRAVRNFRFNESPVAMLNNLVALGRPERISASESGGVEGGGAVVVPALVCRDFTFSSISEAV